MKQKNWIAREKKTNARQKKMSKMNVHKNKTFKRDVWMERKPLIESVRKVKKIVINLVKLVWIYYLLKASKKYDILSKKTRATTKRTFHSAKIRHTCTIGWMNKLLSNQMRASFRHFIRFCHNLQFHKFFVNIVAMFEMINFLKINALFFTKFRQNS